MTLLAARALWWLLPVLGAIIALYLLRMRRQQMRVPATFLWPRVTSDVRANAPIQRLRFSVLLLLQLLAAALVIAALAEPVRRVRGLSGAATVVVLDNAASMSATDVQPTRFDAGVARVRSLIGSLGGTDRLALIDAGAQTRIVFPLSSDKAQMRRALSGLTPSDAPPDMGEALRLASALVNGRPKARIVVLSDGAFPPVTDFSAGRAELSYDPIGISSKNVGVTAFDSALTPSGALQCFASLRNYAPDALPVTVTFKTDGQVEDARQVTIPAGQSVGQTFDAPANARAATVQISAPGDILPSDNQASLFLKGAGTIRTLLVTNGDLFLERALSLEPSIRLETAPDVPAYELAGSPGAGRYDLVIFDNVPPKRVKAPAIWSMGMPSAEYGVVEHGVTPHPAVTDWEHDDPVTQLADFSCISISQAQQIGLISGSGAKTLVQGSGGPLVVSTESAGRRTLYTAWNLLDSDFPLKIAFPIFVANSVVWLTSGQGRAASEGSGGIMATAGQAFSVATPGGAATLIHPDGTRETLDASTGAATIHTADKVGTYQVQGPEVNTQIAVNLLSEAASDVRPRVSLDLAGTSVGAVHANVGTSLSDVWRPIIAGVMVLLAVEWWVFVRRS